MIAYGKLEGKIRDIGSKVQQVFEQHFCFAILALAIYASIQPDVLSGNAIWVIFGCSLPYGILFADAYWWS